MENGQRTQQPSWASGAVGRSVGVAQVYGQPSLTLSSIGGAPAESGADTAGSGRDVGKR